MQLIYIYDDRHKPSATANVCSMAVSLLRPVCVLRYGHSWRDNSMFKCAGLVCFFGGRSHTSFCCYSWHEEDSSDASSFSETSASNRVTCGWQTLSRADLLLGDRSQFLMLSEFVSSAKDVRLLQIHDCDAFALSDTRITSSTDTWCSFSKFPRKSSIVSANFWNYNAAFASFWLNERSLLCWWSSKWILLIWDL